MKDEMIIYLSSDLEAMNPQNRQSPSLDYLMGPSVALVLALVLFIVPCQLEDEGTKVLDTKFGQLIILLLFRFMDMLVTELLRPYFPADSVELGVNMMLIGLATIIMGWGMLR